MPVDVVGVHGIGNRRGGGVETASAQLSQMWSTHLGRPVEVAYYADDLVTEVSQGPSDPDLLPFEAKELVVAWALTLGAPDEVAQGRGTRPIRALLDWVARKFGYDHRLVEQFVARAFREVWAYLYDENSARRVAARDRVAEFIRVRQPRVVIAHSLGSVVTYEALCANPDLRVEALVTLGSPLGMPDVVYPRLNPAVSGRRPRPSGVGTWHNLADHGDLIAIPIGGLFPLFDLDKDHDVTAGLFDFHRVAKYLACEETGALVSGILSRR